MGILIRFPGERCSTGEAWQGNGPTRPATIIILPVVRIERAPDDPGLEPDSAASGRKRRRRTSRP